MPDPYLWEFASLKSIDKALCKLKKDQLKEHLPQLAAEVAEARYMCRKCARVAKHKKMLCKPLSLKQLIAKNVDDNAPQVQDRGELSGSAANS